MTTAVKYATCEERVTAERDRLKAVLAKRGQLFEDEEVTLQFCEKLLNWFQEDRDEADRIELEAMEAEEIEKERKKLADPNYNTKKLFEGVKIKIPTRGM